ncbi:CoA pyrophosphatase [Methylocella sp.]|uniref:CoA pyrophosphatase n=1 Tax=Methylocella sp. TaxID=1978226 RepID=UPI003783227A
MTPQDKRFSPECVFARAKAKLDFTIPDPESKLFVTDPVVDGEDPALFALDRPALAAAVLIGLVDHGEEVRVLLTQRAATLRVHAGQIAFPGGKIEPQDDGPTGAALREAREEIGLLSRDVEPLGFLAPYVTATGFRVTPVVARIAPPLDLRLNPQEVEEAFEAPFAFLMDEANHAFDSRELDGRLRRFYAMAYGERYIWGVTAGILRNLYERLYR